jgi:hypothetical protein
MADSDSLNRPLKVSGKQPQLILQGLDLHGQSGQLKTERGLAVALHKVDVHWAEAG